MLRCNTVKLPCARQLYNGSVSTGNVHCNKIWLWRVMANIDQRFSQLAKRSSAE
jgi:hypothetical protein